MHFEDEDRLPPGQLAFAIGSGTEGRMERIRTVRTLALVVTAMGAGVGACSGGSAASPTFSPIATVVVVNEDAGSPVVSDASTAAGDGGDASAALGDGSVGAIMAAFQERCGASPATGSIPVDVAAVLADKCQPCHNNPQKNGAPFPLLTYEDVHKPFVGATPIYEQMYIQIQPNAQPRMPFGNAPQLTPAEFSTLSTWLIACAPPGD
jgi:hypothetical protein